jgi:hypothetical protein
MIMNARILKIVQIPLLLGLVALFGGCQKKQAPSSSGVGGGGIVSAEATSFDQVTAKLDKGGSFYLYASTAQVLGNLSKTVATWSNFVSALPASAGMGGNRDNIARGFNVVSSLIADSGIEEISGFGASSIARAPGFYFSKAVLYHETGQNDGVIWSVLGKEAHPLKELDLLPENTAFAFYSDYDMPLVWKTLQKELSQLHLPDVDQNLARFPAQFKGQMGFSLDDLLASLGGGYGMIFTADESKKVTIPIPNSPLEIPEPGLAIYIKVKSDLIFDKIDQTLASSPVAAMVSKSEKGGVKSRTVTIPIPLPVDVSPTLARSGDYLFITSSKNLLDEILAVQAGKKSGYKATEEFKKLSQGIPLQGNHFSLISEKFGRTMNGALQGVVSRQAGMLGSQAETVQKMLATNTSLYAFSVAANGPEGWEVMANGNKSMNAMLIPAAIGGAAMVAAVALPAMAKAKAAPQYNQILANLRSIDVAKAQFVTEKNKADGFPVTMDDIAPYLSSPIMPVAGEFYMPNPVGIPPQARLGQAMNGHPIGATVSVANP